LDARIPWKKESIVSFLKKKDKEMKLGKKLAGWDTPKIKVEHSETINHNVYHY